VVFIQKAAEQKRKTLEIKFLHKNVRHGRKFVKLIETMHSLFWEVTTVQNSSFLGLFSTSLGL